MADKQKTVEIIFGGVDKTGKAISSVGGNLDALANRVGSVTGPLANITDSILKLDTALAAAAVAVTGYAVSIADDFDTAFAEIATLIGQPASNLQDFQAQLLEYSETSTASLSQITQATYSAISAGVDYQNSLEIIAASEELAVAGRADLDSTTRALVSTLNAFGAEASEAGAYADDFFTAVQLGQTTIPELSETIGRIAPIAQGAGVSFEELAAAIATITAETGTNTRLAVTGLRSAIAAIINPTKEASDTAAELGIEFGAAALESRGFAGVMADVKEASGGSTEILTSLFGSIESMPTVFALAGESSEVFNENLLKFERNAGAAGTAADQLQADLSKIVQTLKNNINSALIGYGGSLTDETQSIVKSLTSIFNSLGDEIRLDDGVFAPLLNGLEGLAQDIDTKLQRIAENFPEALGGIDLSELLGAFDDLGNELGDAFGAVFGDVDLTTVEGLESALQRVVDAFTALTNISAGIIDGLSPLFELIGEGIDQFESLSGEAKRNVGELLGLAKAVDTLLPAVQGLASGIGSVGTGLTALAGASGFKTIIGNLNSIKSIANTNAGKGGLIGAALGAGYWVGGKLNEWIEEEFGSIGSKLYDLLNDDQLDDLGGGFERTGSAIRDMAKDTASLRELNDRLADSLDNTKESAELDIEALNKRAAELVANANSQEDLNQSLEGYGERQGEATDALGRLTQTVSESGGALAEVADSTKELAENNKTLTLGYDEATGKVNSWSGTIVKSGEAVEDNAKKTEDAIKKSEEYQLKLLEIASDERIAQIESKVSLDIAEVEAGAEKVQALMEGISETFSGTGDLIGELFGEMGDASKFDQLEISAQIRKENERREEALKLQKRLTEAEIEQIKERTRAMARGDAMIQVDGAGLQPHLEAFMFEILREIQVRVNADGQELLLGLQQ